MCVCVLVEVERWANASTQASCFHTSLFLVTPCGHHQTQSWIIKRKYSGTGSSKLLCLEMSSVDILFASCSSNGGLVSYLNRTHGTCVYFFSLATGIRRVSVTSRLPGSPRCFLRLCRGGRSVPSFSRDEASRAGVATFLPKSYLEPRP